VPEIMKPYVRQPGTPEERFPRPVVQVVTPDRCAPPRAEREVPILPLVAYDGPLVLLVLPVPLQRLNR
jgi:hypothetical protein